MQRLALRIFLFFNSLSKGNNLPDCEHNMIIRELLNEKIAIKKVRKLRYDIALHARFQNHSDQHNKFEKCFLKAQFRNFM